MSWPFLALCLAIPAADNVQHGLRLPPGFEITEFADSKLANDIYTLTIDPKGRVVVSGRGYIRILEDTDGDGKADRAREVADGPKDGAMGLLWEGDALFVTGDGGLRRYRIRDDRTDGPSELIRAFKTGGEHDAHAIRRGPDGWLYVLCGNHTGIDDKFKVLPTSPIRGPIAGCVLRFTPDLGECEIVADGFRNAYGMDFNPDGELFTYDSDNERCVSLPWYEGTRFYHVIPGGHYGWRSPQLGQFWRCPPYFADVVAPLADLGRGSPTGVVCYRHAQFPELYRGGLFLLDWTFGRVWFMKLKREGASYACEKQVFLEAVGENGFAPTAAAVHPTTGDLYLSIGGRGTRGAVYRIRYPAGLRSFTAADLAALQPKPRTLDWGLRSKEELVLKASTGEGWERLAALIAVRRHVSHFEPDLLREVINENLAEEDRHVRRAAGDLIADAAARGVTGSRLGSGKGKPRADMALALGRWATRPDYVAESACRVLEGKEADADTRLVAVRLLQLVLGDLTAEKAKGSVWEGYTPRGGNLGADQTQTVASVLRAAFPAGQADLDREISRALAVLEVDSPDVLARVVERLTATSDPVDDLHYLIVIGRLKAPRSGAQTGRIAHALLDLDRKITERKRTRDTFWPLRLTELYAGLAEKDAGLHAAMLANADFGRPDHALFARAAGFDRRRAAEVFVQRAGTDTDYPWTPTQVELLGELSAERAEPLLRRLWDRGGMEESILPLLARRPDAADRARFLVGLGSPRLATIELSLAALEKLPAKTTGAELLPLIRALRRLGESKEEKPLRQRLATLLTRLTSQEIGPDKQAWTAWFSRTYPDLAGKLGNADGVDVAGWQRRLGALDWSAGNAERGRAVFAKASCAACHSGSQALGPDLQGVAGRFSRQDLFTAILQPSLDVSPRYQTTMLTTADGKTYQGVVIYEAVGSVMLQTGPTTTERLVDRQIIERRFSQTSLMPVGLLDKLTDAEIADLYAYLRGLQAAPSSGASLRGR